MLIPIFVSCPSALSEEQERSRKLILRELTRAGLEARTLGRSDYPTTLPLREVLSMAKHCSGAVILGFEHFYAPNGSISKRNSAEEKHTDVPTSHPTAWNHLEAGVMYSFSLPLLVFAEPDIRGGIFDLGTSDVFVHPMPKVSTSTQSPKALRAVFQKWQAEVREHYYR